jgi:hypothetical protein
MDSYDEPTDEKTKKRSDDAKNNSDDIEGSDDQTASHIAAIESRIADEETSEQSPVEVPESKPEVEAETKPDPAPSPDPLPAVTPVSESRPLGAVAPADTHHSSPALIILQWLTYAFWGWTLLAVIALVGLVVGNFFDNFDTSAILPYSIAAVLVLLPLSLICDLFYGRSEPTRKSGGATVVMVIHAVIFALFGIGLLIGLVFTLVNQGINGFSSFDSVRTALVTLAISVILYALTFLRTLNPTAVVPIARIYRIAMLAIIGLFIVLAFVGPAARSAATRDDREIVANISAISESVNNYIVTNNKFPASLSDVNLKDRAKALVDKGLVKYKSDGKEAAIDSYEDEDARYVSDEYRYQLCVTYKEKTQGYGDRYSTIGRQDSYEDYLYVYDHPAGEVCYKLKATVEQDSQRQGVSVDALKI